MLRTLRKDAPPICIRFLFVVVFYLFLPFPPIKFYFKVTPLFLYISKTQTRAQAPPRSLRWWREWNVKYCNLIGKYWSRDRNTRFWLALRYTDSLYYSSIRPVLDFFGCYYPTPHHQSLMVRLQDATRYYNFLCDERICIYMYYSRCCCCFFYATKRISSDNFRKWEATTKEFLSKRGTIFSHTWLDTLKTKDDTQAVYCRFDMKIIMMPLWKERKAWTVDIARSLAMLQKNT